MIRVVGVTQHYGVRPVLRDVSLEIEPGLVVALMGPNGSGKSTLLGVMAGLLSPMKGLVEIDGLVRKSSVEAELAIRRKVVYLSSEPWLPPWRTGREFLLSVGRLYGIEYDRLFDHVERLLQLFDLGPLADSPISSYSAGQRKKIALSSALVTEAPVMLLDEPFSGGLDPTGIQALKEVMLHLARRDDVTVLMSTPVPELVEEIAERIAILRGGTIAAYDTADGLRRQTGCTGSLAEVLERLINPAAAENIRHYFEGKRP